MPTSHGSTVSTTVAGKSFTASASPPQSNVAERVYQIIDDLCLQASGPVWLSQKELAQTLEVTPRTINRVIARLKQSRRLIVAKTGADLSYLTSREPAQFPLVAAITAAPSPRSRSSAAKPVTPPQPATANRPQIDTHTMVDGQSQDADTTADGSAMDRQWTGNGPVIDNRWTGDGPAMDNRWTTDGQPMDRRWTTDGPAMDNRWTGDGPAMDAHTTPDSQPVDSLAKRDNEPIEDPDENPAIAVWEQALAQISNQLPPGAFQAFFASSVGVRFDGNSLTVAVRNSRAVEWLERPLHQEIAQTALKQVSGRELSVEYQEDPTLAVEAPHGVALSQKTSWTPLKLSPCSRCGPDTMSPTMWPSLKRLSGETYYCRGAGACSRLWNSVVGEFRPPGEEQLDPEAARDMLRRVLQNRPRSHH